MADSTKRRVPPTMPQHIYSFAYDSLWLLHRAVDQAKASDTKSVMSALE
ncbi:ABC transporter substrate-binding protein [Streptomyces albipurpureus]|uniref:ABC transporter substrate-binding protein n=1 Tax=Streptomyces albipurpureus TaxID=2897419 RepID=A0ABT0UZZ8_9ACTN|nr:ABC transporter substrate-binding protein [Streptomyces sp. CWNU-1]MCM2394167.1 ABC transporter substrate-binding protein [Streptomyces sp. CWNU-1]